MFFQVAILAFNSTTSFSSVDSCFNRELAIGTTENLNNLKQFLMANVTVDPNDRSNLTNALRKAFDLFAATTFTAGLMFENNGLGLFCINVFQTKPTICCYVAIICWSISPGVHLTMGRYIVDKGSARRPNGPRFDFRD